MEDKKMKVKKGWLAVRVGLEEEGNGFQRFVIPIAYLYHPLFKKLLDRSKEVYGYHTSVLWNDRRCSMPLFSYMSMDIPKCIHRHDRDALIRIFFGILPARILERSMIMQEFPCTFSFSHVDKSACKLQWDDG
ncbi:hypothetical protein GIB67_000794 [Kingdonia uniflora]|uniref:Uncharacterized protein n=1 Tax=Kingdonia uniflora TaxID=39325 RepID=A0A7J7NZW4_9MAGN|nr:hypothetical protein GIB67_000794 [Kingdonia uniflora]